MVIRYKYFLLDFTTKIPFSFLFRHRRPYAPYSHLRIESYEAHYLEPVLGNFKHLESKFFPLTLNQPRTIYKMHVTTHEFLARSVRENLAILNNTSREEPSNDFTIRDSESIDPWDQKVFKKNSDLPITISRGEWKSILSQC